MDSILEGIKSLIAGLFGKGGDNVSVGIDVGTSSIKVVQLKRENGRAVLDTYGALALGQYQKDASPSDQHAILQK